MDSSQLLYQIALTLIPQVGPVHARSLLQYLEPQKIFTTKKALLEKIEGIGTFRAEAIRAFRNFEQAEKEIKFIEKAGITAVFIQDNLYPKRLLNCYDPPIMLYYKGDASLNASKVIAIIGTRNHTEYGKLVTEKLIRDLVSHEVMIISGLAFGIDAIAHRSALKNNLTTIGVMAHGLNRVYPNEHIPLAKDMIRQGGGLITEFNSFTKPDKHNFPVRNRVVAGMSDAVIVIETGIKGGSMITAELANGYNRDVFAYPGRASDQRSAGCNLLIRKNKAVLLNSGTELIEEMGWNEEKGKTLKRTSQRELFIELDGDEKIIVNILQEKDAMHIDEINQSARLSNSSVAAAILSLELKGAVLSKPGKLYCLT